MSSGVDIKKGNMFSEGLGYSKAMAFVSLIFPAKDYLEKYWYGFKGEGNS